MAYGPFDLSGKTALVTGGNGGIGLGMADAMAQSGANVCIWGTNAEKNAAALEQLLAHGTEVEAMICDVSDEAQVEELPRDRVTQHRELLKHRPSVVLLPRGVPAFPREVVRQSRAPQEDERRHEREARVERLRAVRDDVVQRVHEDVDHGGDGPQAVDVRVRLRDPGREEAPRGGREDDDGADLVRRGEDDAGDGGVLEEHRARRWRGGRRIDRSRAAQRSAARGGEARGGRARARPRVARDGRVRSIRSIDPRLL